MKSINYNRQKSRYEKGRRILKKIRQGNEHIRLRVTKTNVHIYIQAINDQEHKTLAFSSSQQLKLKNGNLQNSMLVAKDLLKKIKSANITQMVLDRGSHKYHGKIAEIANFFRQEGIKI